MSDTASEEAGLLAAPGIKCIGEHAARRSRWSHLDKQLLVDENLFFKVAGLIVVILAAFDRMLANVVGATPQRYHLRNAHH